MNTKAVKSFGLALIVAVGVLALLLATGTFSPQKAAAADLTADSVEVTPKTAVGGAVLPITIEFTIINEQGALVSGQELTIAFPKGFGVPGTIDPSDISIRSGSTAGIPANVTVDGTTIMLELGDDSDGIPIFIEDTGTARVYITFTRAAGITAPIAANAYGVTVNDVGGTGTPVSNEVVISPTVKITPASGPDETKITITGTSFSDGAISIFVNQTSATPADPVADATDLGDAIVEDVNVSGGTGTFETTVTVDYVAAAGAGNFGPGANYIHVYDSEDARADGDPDTDAIEGALFRLTGTVIAAPKSPFIKGQQGIQLDLTKAITTDTPQVTGVTIGEVAVPFGPAVVDPATDPVVPVADDAMRTLNGGPGDAAAPVDLITTTTGNGTVSVKINVGADVPTGKQLLVLMDAEGDGTDDDVVLGSVMVEINAIELGLSPSTAVQGMTVRVTASGFGGGVTSTADLKIQGAATDDNPVIDDQSGLARGQYSFNFTVPDLPDGEAKVTLTQNNGVVGEGTLTIAKPTISIDPTESRIDTAVTVTGTGFPAKDLIDIKYGRPGDVLPRIESANSDDEGNWVVDIHVPSGASGTNDVVAVRSSSPARGDDRMADPVEHTVPAGSVSYSSTEGVAGDKITVSGEAYEPFRAVVITLGGAPVGSGITDPAGDFSIEVTIPIFRPDSFQTLSVEIDEKAVDQASIKILSAPTAPASTDPEDVFADLIEAGVLIEFWGYNNDAGEWQVFNPSLSEGESMALETAGVLMTSTSSIEAGWLNLSGDATFQGKARSAGWSLIPLN